MATYENHKFALLENNTLWVWGGKYKYPKQILDCEVKDFIICNGHDMFVLDTDGNVKRYYTGKYCDFDKMTLYETSNVLENIVELSTEMGSSETFFAITESGSVWAWGNNSFGQLGDGTTQNAEWSTPTLVDFSKSIEKIVTTDNATAFLTTEDELSVTGAGKYVVPNILSENVRNIYDSMDSNLFWVELTNEVGLVYTYGDLKNINIVNNKINDTHMCSYHQSYIEEGKVYIKSGYNDCGYYRNYDYTNMFK
jgi:hypothetical protein